MDFNFENYLKKRPYRKKFAEDPVGSELLRMMDHRFKRPFSGYWEKFGYEIGGPVCLAYTMWVRSQIREHPEITDIAFVARDGWILSRIYSSLSQKDDLRLHYIYAPRTLALQCQNENVLYEYRAFLDIYTFGNGSVAVVDTVTMKFSSQRLLSLALEKETLGLFWVVLHSYSGYEQGFNYRAYQKEKYHKILCWNLMEFIMTSPEPSIRGIKNGRPVYRTASPAEAEREKLFLQIENGVMAFAEDALAAGKMSEIDNGFITEWVNDFLRHPNEEDRQAFQNIVISEREDHSDQIPMNPFSHAKSLLSLKEMKDRLWYYSQNHERLYRFLHRGKRFYKEVLDKLHGMSFASYDGKHPESLAESLSTYDVVSFDVFDTLVLRPLDKPTDLFRMLERDNGLFDFHDNRIQAEADARRKKKNKEVNIYDIYEELVPRYGLDSREAAKREIEAEIQICFANDELTTLYQILKEKKVCMVAVTDMYLPSQTIRRILDGCGFSAIKPIFVSCEYGAGKTGGILQRIVQDKMGDTLKFIHIGDNLDSDIRGSIAAGWAAIRYVRKGRQQA